MHSMVRKDHSRRSAVAAALLTVALALPAAAQTAPGGALPSWIAVDSTSKLVTLTLEATADPAGGAARISGERDGSVQVVVPRGWTVEWRFRNLDATATHSLIVMAEREKLPAQGGQPAFENAMTKSLLKGLPRAADDRPQDVSRFEADQAGWYWMLDGVPGQALKGTYIGLKVDPAASGVSVVRKG